jgi:sarcosine oxidase
MRVRFAVVGGGGIGSAAAYWLSRRAGADVVCLEQWALGHALGASEDHSRIIRLGYHSADYTALTPSSYEAWRVVEEESGVPLVHRTGMVNLARPARRARGSSTPTSRR